MPFEPTKTLNSRTFIGLVLAQFLAAFNDQAVHIAAILYGGDMLVRYANARLFGSPVDETLIISLVTGCFITPFFLFSPLAGILADKYSKRNVLVFWKWAEVAIMGLCFTGFLLPHLASLAQVDPQVVAQWSAYLVIAGVFLMGTHSAFFIPAKYGVMPEILHSTVLSRGNGILEGTSFVANILGTSFGGLLYGRLKSEIDDATIHLGHEWLIGAVLLGLAVIGAVASLLIQRMPAATPHRRLRLNPWVPLKDNFTIAGKSRSLVLALVGISFFSFMTLFLRQTLLYQGETDKEQQWIARKINADQVSADKQAADAAKTNESDNPLNPKTVAPKATRRQAAELVVALLLSVLGLGVGIGCLLAGYLSGHRLELGLVPIGTAMLVVLTGAMSLARPGWSTIVCLWLVGVSAGLYIVPLYTLLQHRAPKDSKGNMVATSSFLNVAGGIIAVLVFFFFTYGLQNVFSLHLTHHQVSADHDLLPQYRAQLETQQIIPRVLYLSGSLITAAMLLGLCWHRPDFIVRTLWFIKHHGKRDLQATGLHHLPSYGPVVLVTNCTRLERMLNVLAVTDRLARFVVSRVPEDFDASRVSRFVRRAQVLTISGDTAAGNASATEALATALRTINEGHLVGLAFDDQPDPVSERLLSELHRSSSATLLPVYCSDTAPNPLRPDGPPVSLVAIGEPLPADASIEEIRRALQELSAAEPAASAA